MTQKTSSNTAWPLAQTQLMSYFVPPIAVPIFLAVALAIVSFYAG